MIRIEKWISEPASRAGGLLRHCSIAWMRMGGAEGKAKIMSNQPIYWDGKEIFFAPGDSVAGHLSLLVESSNGLRGYTEEIKRYLQKQYEQAEHEES